MAFGDNDKFKVKPFRASKLNIDVTGDPDGIWLPFAKGLLFKLKATLAEHLKGTASTSRHYSFGGVDIFVSTSPFSDFIKIRAGGYMRTDIEADLLADPPYAGSPVGFGDESTGSSEANFSLPAQRYGYAAIRWKQFDPLTETQYDWGGTDCFDLEWGNIIPGGGSFTFRIDNGKQLFLAWTGSTSSPPSSWSIRKNNLDVSSLINDGAWNILQVAWDIDGQTIKAYINGVDTGIHSVLTVTGTPVSTNNQLDTDRMLFTFGDMQCYGHFIYAPGLAQYVDLDVEEVRNQFRNYGAGAPDNGYGESYFFCPLFKQNPRNNLGTGPSLNLLIDENFDNTTLVFKTCSTSF